MGLERFCAIYDYQYRPLSEAPLKVPADGQNECLLCEFDLLIFPTAARMV